MKSIAALLAVSLLIFACQAEESAPPGITRQKSGLLALGSGLPDLRGISLDGKVITNADMAGKTILLNTWFFE